MSGQSPERLSDDHLAADLARMEAYGPGRVFHDFDPEALAAYLRELQEARAALAAGRLCPSCWAAECDTQGGGS